MAQKDKIDSFVSNIFQQNKGKKLSKQNILSMAESASFAADIVIFFKDLPDKSYDEDSLIDELNNIIHSRGRESAIGGLLRKPAKV